MSTLILLLMGVSAFHFVYHGMIAPTLRTRMRYQLFTHRDDLRLLRCKGELSVDAFMQIEQVINNSINLLPVIGVASLFHFIHRESTDAELRARIDRSSERYAAIPYAAAKEYQRLCGRVCFNAMIVNGGTWIPLILPFIVLFVCSDKIRKKTKELVAVPENDVQSIFPSPYGVQTVTA